MASEWRVDTIKDRLGTGAPNAPYGIKSEGEYLSPHGFKNWIINGNPSISQRGDYSSATSATNATYYADRWKTSFSGMTCDIQSFTTNQPTTRSTTSIRITATSTATGVSRLRQEVEHGGYLYNQSVTIGAWVKSNTSNAGFPTSQASGRHSGGGDWEFLYYTVTITGATTNIVYIGIQSTSGGTVSISSGDYCEFTMAQQEEGSFTTPFEHRPYGLELSLCQRYYEYVNNMTFAFYEEAGNYGRVPISFNTAKREIPTITLTDGTLYNVTASSTSGITTRGFNLGAQATATGHAVWGNASSGAYVADAEL